MRRALAGAGDDWRDMLEREARAIEVEDPAAHRRMGELGAGLIEPGIGVLTHCNTGSLATAGFGTALGLLRAAAAPGPIDAGCAAHTRPEMRGSALPDREEPQAGRHRGELGAGLIEPGSGVLTHCNTGSLATAGFGTALGVIRAGVALGRIDKVFADETRPWMQGSRLTVWELQQDGIDATLIADAAASHLMKDGQVDWVVVGADRICANGDVANKIGTYQLAISARHLGKKFMVVAPSSTVDMDTASGDLIEIEERDPAELLGVAGSRIVAEGIRAGNPVFDVTPAALIDGIVTEKGIVERKSEEHTSELQSILRNSYAVSCYQKK